MSFYTHEHWPREKKKQFTIYCDHGRWSKGHDQENSSSHCNKLGYASQCKAHKGWEVVFFNEISQFIIIIYDFKQFFLLI